LSKVENLFGLEAAQHIRKMTTHRLKRKHTQYHDVVIS